MEGYDSDCNSWEDALALNKICPELIKIFPDIFNISLDSQKGEQILLEGQVKLFVSGSNEEKEGGSSGELKRRKMIITSKRVILGSSEENSKEEFNVKGMEVIENIPKNSKLKLLLDKGESGFIVNFAIENSNKMIKYNFLITGGSKTKDLWIMKLNEAKIGEEGGLEGIEKRERLLKEKEKKLKDKERKLYQELEELKQLKKRARAVANHSTSNNSLNSSGSDTKKKRWNDDRD